MMSEEINDVTVLSPNENHPHLRLVDKLAEVINEEQLDGARRVAEYVGIDAPSELPIPDTVEDEGPQPPELPERELNALWLVEQQRAIFESKDLAEAYRELQHVQTKIERIKGGIEAASIMVARVLDQYGVSTETYEKQKSETFNTEAFQRAAQMLPRV